MPKKNEKSFLGKDDRPSRFLLDLKINEPFDKLEQPKKRESLFSFLDEPEVEKIEYTEPVRKKIKEPKLNKIKIPANSLKEFFLFKIFGLLYYSCYKVAYFFINLPIRFYNRFIFPVRHFLKKRNVNQTATPGTRALMTSPKILKNPLLMENNFEEIPVEFTIRRRIIVFATLLFVLILPLKGLSYLKNVYDLRGKVMGVSEEAAAGLKGAAEQAANLNFEQATQDFSSASIKFMDAKNEIGAMSKVLNILGTVIPNKDIKLAKNADLILDAGRISADIGSNLTMAFSTLAPEKEKNIKVIVNSFYFYTSKSAVLAKELEEKVSKIQVKYLPEEYQSEFAQLQNKAGTVSESLNEVVDLLVNMQTFLGFNYDKRYLLVFQNNTELRASGGFVGSYALIDFRNGEIKNLEIPGGGSYDTEAGLKERIIAPEALQMVNPLWHFWDSNWWPDWPTSARKLMWFYEKSDGPSVDGVISFTPTVLENLLKIIGPIDLTAEHGVVIDADNFWLETQRIAEEKPKVNTEVATNTEAVAVRHEPKKIIGDLMNKIIEVLPERLDKDMFIDLVGTVEDSLNEKHVMFYFTDENLENKTIQYGWDGAMKQTAFDYLMVINTNVAGGKTDKVIRETINHKAEVAWDGTVIDTVTIKREHTGERGQEFTGVRNNDWLRVYVPEGSELIQAGGFSIPDEKYFEAPDKDWKNDPDIEATEGQAVTDLESGTKIYNENGKTVFANWSQIDPGQTALITLKYRLPFKLEEQVKANTWINKVGDFLTGDEEELTPYALLVQKQPGSLGDAIHSELKLHSNFNAEWFYQDNAASDSSGWEYNDVLKTDKFWATLLRVGGTQDY